jgi:hypothetical protein
MYRPDSTQVVTISQNGSSRRWLGQLGNVGDLWYSFTCPGGPAQMQCTLMRDSRFRTDALDPGRIVQLIRGGSVVWDGRLDEPDGSQGVWQISAHGAGTFGNDFVAYYTGAWTANPDSAVNNAITRGLRWVNPGIGFPTGIWLSQSVDPGMQSITDMMNLVTSKGGLTWYVSCRPRGNVLSVFPLPTVASRLLMSTTPAVRTLYGDINAVYERYQVSADSDSSPAAFSTTSTIEQSSIDKYGRMEVPADLSSVGTISAATAQSVGRFMLDRYQRANFGSAFTVSQGQIMTMGGTPVDLGMEQAGGVYRVILTNTGFGGELSPVPINIMAGEYKWDDEAGIATVTPFQSFTHDFASLLSNATQFAPQQGR